MPDESPQLGHKVPPPFSFAPKKPSSQIPCYCRGVNWFETQGQHSLHALHGLNTGPIIGPMRQRGQWWANTKGISLHQQKTQPRAQLQAWHHLWPQPLVTLPHNQLARAGRVTGAVRGKLVGARQWPKESNEGSMTTWTQRYLIPLTPFALTP